MPAVAHVRSADLDGDPEREVEFRTRAGMTAPLVDLRIVDPDMKDVPHDGKSAGEIVLRAPWLTQGYFNNPEGSEELWAGGYLHTSDIAVIDADGYVHITDRIKDVIKTGGEWVSSLQIEDLISQCPGVAEAAVIGVKDDKWGERPIALVVKGPDALMASPTRASRPISRSSPTRASFRNTEFRRRSCSSTAPQDQRRQDQQEGAARAVRRHVAVAYRAPTSVVPQNGRKEAERGRFHPC